MKSPKDVAFICKFIENFFSHSEVEKIDFFHISSIWVNSNQPSWDFGDNQNFDFATNRKSTISDDLEHS